MDKVSLDFDTGIPEYPFVTVVYQGTFISKYYNDSYLHRAIFDAVRIAGDPEDIYDFASLIYSSVNQAVKRHYRGQELMLQSVEVCGANNYSVTIEK